MHHGGEVSASPLDHLAGQLLGGTKVENDPRLGKRIARRRPRRWRLSRWRPIAAMGRRLWLSSNAIDREPEAIEMILKFSKQTLDLRMIEESIDDRFDRIRVVEKIVEDPTGWLGTATLSPRNGHIGSQDS